MSGSLGAAGKNVSATMIVGKAGINKFSQQTLPPLILLLRKLDSIAVNLEKLSAEMSQNPAIILRGSTPRKTGPGE
jgi:phospholipid/cholesterol/gamma-HCH transport system substrate-binding protein